MMAESVQLELPSGHVVWVRLELPPDGAVDVGRRGPTAAVVLEGLREIIEGVTTSVQESLGSLRSTEVGVELGIEFEARAGKAIAVLADVGGKTSVKVSLRWSSE